jgi:hypothetical protein
MAQVWQWLTDIREPCPWLPGTISLRQQDAGELGRGSVVQVRGQHQYWSVSVTYWEPPKTLELIRTVWYGTLVYRLHLAQESTTALCTSAQLQVTGLAPYGQQAWWIKPLLWFEWRRLKRWLTSLPTRLGPQDGAAPVNTIENREVD